MQARFPSDSGKYPKKQNQCNESNLNISSIAYVKTDSDKSQDTDYREHKRVLELAEESDIIKHKNFLFYCLIIFLVLLFFGSVILMFIDKAVLSIIFIFIFLILLGILIVYFVSKKNRDEHYILNLIFNFINDMMIRIFGF